MKKLSLTTVLGWIGVVCILSAYAGTSFSFLSNQSVLYLVLNILGSAGIIIEAREKKDLPALFLNIIWISIAIIGIVRVVLIPS